MYKRVEIVITPIGGLANRMRAIASAVALARDAQAVLRIVWQPNEELGASFGSLFEIDAMPVPIDSVSLVSYAFRFAVPRFKNLFLPELYQRLKFRLRIYDGRNMQSFRDDPSRLLAAVKSAGTVFIASGVEFYPVEDNFFRDSFVPVKNVIEEIDSIAGDFDENVVGIHIRRTDNLQSIAHSPLSMFIDAMQSIYDANPNSRFYVASDDETVKRTLADRFGDKVIVSDRQADRTTLEGMVHGAAEMYALARTSRIIGSHWSSYSETAARIGGIALQQLYR